jgi:hypothetical protein
VVGLEQKRELTPVQDVDPGAVIIADRDLRTVWREGHAERPRAAWCLLRLDQAEARIVQPDMPIIRAGDEPSFAIERRPGAGAAVVAIGYDLTKALGLVHPDAVRPAQARD